MSKGIPAGILSLLFSLSLMAGDGEYAVSKISPALLKNANAVLRLEEIRFEIISTTHTDERNHYVITVLNENGDDWAYLAEGYDKLKKITSVEGFLYDANGKELKHMKSKDLEDKSNVSEGSLFEDDRIKTHSFYYKAYPYTVEYTINTEYNNTLAFPRWIPQGGENLSVVQSMVSIVCPLNYQFRYKSFNYPGEPVYSQEKNTKTTTWAIKDLPAIKREIYSPLWHELTTTVIFGPTDFQVDDYKGNMENWQGFGKFTYTLKNGRDQLPDNIKQVVHRIADPVSDTKEKIAKLYEYMQKNTRYVSVQLGIGGWQPFDATYVATKGYGDCKALTNYMYSILKEAGITSCYTLIRSGNNAGYITDDFPSQQFNHVILSVPLQKDTMWLECTSQTLPAGYLSEFTDDRYALMVNEDGGKLVRTPKYGMKENLETRKVTAMLDDEATLSVKSVTDYGGLQQDLYHSLMNDLSKDKVKEYLHEQLDFATYTINDFEYNETRSSLPVVDEKLDITVNNYATITGKRLFIVPNVMTRAHRKLPADSIRKYDLELGYAYKDVDSVAITLPQGYTTESMPRDVSISNKFGKYNCSVKLSGNQLLYYRIIEHYGGRFPASDYADLVKFYDTIYKADRNKVVLVKTETPAKPF